MAALLELGLVLLALLLLFKLLKEAFRRTPPDDREPPEDSLVTAGLDNPRKPGPRSVKLDLPKDPD
jgi:hypothetical protein